MAGAPKKESVLAILNCNGFYAPSYYQSISDFRKQRPSGLKNLFKLFVFFLKILTSLDVKSSLLMAQKQSG
jgi:hypothetical protein